MTDAIPQILVEQFSPYSDVLLEKCCELVTDDMLEEISVMDYGMDAGLHLAALRAIRDETRVPSPLLWEPKEVLELTRWSEPDDPAEKPSRTGERGHVMRAFCCAALLRAGADPESARYILSENATMIQLIDSARFLNRGLPEAAGSFLTWRIPQLRDDGDERPFFAFGLVALGLLHGEPAPTASDVDDMVKFVEQAEINVRDPAGVCAQEMLGGSLLDCTCHDLRHNAWRALARQLRSRMPESHRLVAMLRRIEAKDGETGPNSRRGNGGGV